MTSIEYLRLIAKSEAISFDQPRHWQFTVEEIVKTFFSGSQASTKPYPMREGYAESLL